MNFTDRRGFLFFSSLNPRDRRAILIGLGILIPAAGYVLAWKPYRASLDDVRDRVVAEQELLYRELEVMETSGSLSQEIQQARAEADGHEEKLVRAASGVLAEAELTDFLESSASRSRVLLEEIRGGELGRGEEPPPGLSVVRLHLRGESDLEGVLTFLNEIEKSHLLVRIRGLALEPEMARPESENDEGGNRTAIPTGVVEFQLIVDGFARLEEYGS
jgi:hypothetical protein